MCFVWLIRAAKSQLCLRSMTVSKPTNRPDSKRFTDPYFVGLQYTFALYLFLIQLRGICLFPLDFEFVNVSEFVREKRRAPAVHPRNQDWQCQDGRQVARSFSGQRHRGLFLDQDLPRSLFQNILNLVNLIFLQFDTDHDGLIQCEEMQRTIRDSTYSFGFDHYELQKMSLYLEMREGKPVDFADFCYLVSSC